MVLKSFFSLIVLVLSLKVRDLEKFLVLRPKKAFRFGKEHIPFSSMSTEFGFSYDCFFHDQLKFKLKKNQILAKTFFIFQDQFFFQKKIGFGLTYNSVLMRKAVLILKK